MGQMLSDPLRIESDKAWEVLSIHRTHCQGGIRIWIEMALKDSSYLGHHAEVQSHVAAFFLFCQPSHPQRVLYNRVQRYPANAIDGARRVFHDRVVFIGLIFLWRVR